MLPLEVLQRAGSEITNYQGSGMSVMEMSHRSKVFLRIFEETQEKLRRLMRVPDGYRVLLLQTGASGQFSISAKVTLKAGSDATPMQRGILMEGLYRRSDGTLASNIGGVCSALMAGTVVLGVGLAAALASILGHYLGAGLAIRNGSKIVRPAVVVVLLLLLVKVISEMLFPNFWN